MAVDPNDHSVESKQESCRGQDIACRWSQKSKGKQMLLLTSLAVEGPSFDSAILRYYKCLLYKIVERLMILELKCQRLGVDQRAR